MIEVEGQLVENSEAVDIAAALIAALGRDGAHAAIDEVFDVLPAVDAAALWHDWSLWARPKQMPRGDFISWGYLTGRGFGKTFGISKWIVGEIMDGRARMLGLAAQDEENCIALQVLGPSGLIAASPPWFQPRWDATRMWLVWPNGAKAIVRTPEVPGKIRGFDYDLVWITEIQSWPAATRDEAISNFRLACRIGLARTIWDATPKRKHPVLREFLADHARDPARYVVVRGTTHENAVNLADGYIEELQKKYGGTTKGREELLGEMLDDVEGALFRAAWFTRRRMPDAWARRIVAIDPAVTERQGSDTTGIIEAGLAHDGKVGIIADNSGKHAPAAWADDVLNRYVAGRCDLVLVETNKGGDLIAQNLRSAAAARRMRVEIVGKQEKPRHVPGVVHVKEVYARGAKEDRAQPAAIAYERGRVFHVEGANLSSLEDTLTTWEPSPYSKSPGDLDALAHAVVELLDLASDEPDPKAAFAGISEVAKRIAVPAPAATSSVASSLAAVFRGVNGGRI